MDTVNDDTETDDRPPMRGVPAVIVLGRTNSEPQEAPDGDDA